MFPAKNTPSKSEEPKEEEASVVPPQEIPNHDDTDVEAVLARQTQDGKGADDVPESNFESFATEDVERDKSDLDIAHEILDGKWGYRRSIVLGRLRAQGLDALAIFDEVKRLQDSGKPSTLSD